MKMNVDSVEKAIKNFRIYADMKKDPNRQWELLTGDWKQVTYYESK